VDRPTLGFIGIGTVGTALARALAAVGYAISAVSSRTQEDAERLTSSLPKTRVAETPQGIAEACDLCFLTVNDDAIEPLAQSIDWPPRCAVVHCSGTASIDILGAAAEDGSSVGVFHPLQTFASPEQAALNIPGSTFGIEASTDDLARMLSEMALALGGTPLRLSGEKAIYHASAVIASNYLVTLLQMASSLWEKLGLSAKDGLDALLPLVRGTLANLEQVGLPDALTGPIARGDVGTVERHLDVLGCVAPELLPAYKELARRTIPIGRAKGSLDDASATRLSARLDAEHDVG